MKFWHVLAMCAGLALTGCPDTEEAKGPGQDAPRGGFQDRAQDVSLSLEDRLNDPLSLPRIPMNSEDITLHVVNANLDIDQLEEQVIIFKKRSDPEDRIRIMVADFDNVRASYVVAWQAETSGTNSSSFSLELIDLLGDHVPEILCFGRDSRGEQTLDVFRKTLPPQGFGIYYTQIAEISSSGSIEIEQKPRSEAYRLMQRNDESFPLVVYEKDPSSTNINDLIKIFWFWNHQDAAFRKGKTEKIAGQAIAEKQLAELFSKGAEEFEGFLDGPWYRTGSDSGDASLGEILQFDVKNRRIIFFTTGMQQIFIWQNSYRTIYRAIYLNCTNESISNITSQLSISVSGMNSFDLTVKGEEGWDGQYRRLGQELQASFISAGQKQVKIASVNLSGLYRNDSGTEIYFSSPRFTMRENGKESAGGYVVYSFDGDILEMKVLKNNGLVDSVKTFKITYQEEKQGRQILRNLLLQPAEVRSTGVQVKALGEIRLQQIAEE
ncbi:MAG: pallilysin-related adhesin [Spirochaetales bacterium]|nr:pallilysin-related adhesin [Spirochaetales bacterium]